MRSQTQLVFLFARKNRIYTKFANRSLGQNFPPPRIRLILFRLFGTHRHKLLPLQIPFLILISPSVLFSIMWCDVTTSYNCWHHAVWGKQNTQVLQLLRDVGVRESAKRQIGIEGGKNQVWDFIILVRSLEYSVYSYTSSLLSDRRSESPRSKRNRTKRL